MKSEVSIVSQHAQKVLSLKSAQLGDEYFYQSLPLCVIDAVFSIAVRYEGVRNTVARYCSYFNLKRIREPRHTIPPKNDQESISKFCVKMDGYDFSAIAKDIFRNRQRTSARSGILKAEAVYHFASVLRKHGVEHIQQAESEIDNCNLRKDILAIRGQKSGISLDYFFVLSGSDNLIKTDRHILMFLEDTLGRPVGVSEARDLLSNATGMLRITYPHLTARLLDHEIWKYQRAVEGT